MVSFRNSQKVFHLANNNGMISIPSVLASFINKMIKLDSIKKLISVCCRIFLKLLGAQYRTVKATNERVLT